VSLLKREAYRELVAENPSIPLEWFASLARAAEPSVRKALAGNKSIPLSAATLLSRDSDKGVRLALASNTNAPPNVLDFLAEDKSPGVRFAVASNPSCPSERTARWLNSTNPAILEQVAQQKRVPVNEQLRILATLIRTRGAKNRCCELAERIRGRLKNLKQVLHACRCIREDHLVRIPTAIFETYWRP
jgi:hypothetical protein